MLFLNILGKKCNMQYFEKLIRDTAQLLMISTWSLGRQSALQRMVMLILNWPCPDCHFPSQRIGRGLPWVVVYLYEDAGESYLARHCAVPQREHNYDDNLNNKKTQSPDSSFGFFAKVNVSLLSSSDILFDAWIIQGNEILFSLVVVQRNSNKEYRHVTYWDIWNIFKKNTVMQIGNGTKWTDRFK